MLIAPKDPDRSVLYQRVSRRGNGQMPPLATKRIDRRAVDLIHDWIKQIEVPDSSREDVDRAFAEVQGESGIVSRWYATGPLYQHPDADVLSHVGMARSSSLEGGEDNFKWQALIGRGPKCRIRLAPAKTATPESIWLARSDVIVNENCEIELSAGASGLMHVWLNGKRLVPKEPLVSNEAVRQQFAGANRYEANLVKGRNRVLVKVVSVPNGPTIFEAGFRRKSSNSQHEEYTVAALSRTGNTARGRHLFRDSQKTQCSQCHQIENEGGQVGPDLTGVGSRLSPARMIESILEPSRTVAPNYRTVVIELASGRILTGIVSDESPGAVTVKNDQAKELVISKSQILQIQSQPVSLMPAGLAKSITKEEFIDLISYLKQLTASVDSPERVTTQ
jgi:putative heme-binding domain-containing protein